MKIFYSSLPILKKNYAELLIVPLFLFKKCIKPYEKIL